MKQRVLTIIVIGLAGLVAAIFLHFTVWPNNTTAAILERIKELSRKGSLTAQIAKVPGILDIMNRFNPSSDTAHMNSTNNATKGGFKRTVTSLFWVGEIANAENGFIANDKSAWDTNWIKHYGGVDSPTDRCGFAPCSFTPRENPFYFALPYNDLDMRGRRKATAYDIPWFDLRENAKSVVKNMWIEIKFDDSSCYAQWQDVGPSESDDFSYVFGTSTPKNAFGVKAGLDVSPAVWDCLGLKDNVEIEWRFIPESEVPDGPWKKTVTTRDVSW